MGIEDLAPEQLGKARACKSADELATFAKSEGVELTDEQLKKISGGDWDGEETVSYTQKCMGCGNVNQWYEGQTEPLYCQFCGQQLLKLP